MWFIKIKAQEIQLERISKLEDKRNDPKFSTEEKMEIIKESQRTEKNQHMFSWSPRNTGEMSRVRGTI